MRVISGNFKGLNLVIPKSDLIRPTTDKVKESIFNIIQYDIHDKIFLDLFSGTGQIGIEALSRGAKKVIMVDKNKEALKLIKINTQKLKSNLEKISIVNLDSLKFLDLLNEKVDIAFLDPPYNSDILYKCFSKLTNLMNENSIIITETEYNNNVTQKINNFILQKTYKYGRIAINVYNN